MELTLSKSKLLLATFLTPLIFSACGGEKTNSSLDTLNTQNYIEIAKKIYAKKNGKYSDIQIKEQLPPGAKIDANTLYLTNFVKPRDRKITQIEAKQADNTISIKIDEDNKYAVITLSGTQNTQTTIDMKKFTLSN